MVCGYKSANYMVFRTIVVTLLRVIRRARNVNKTVLHLLTNICTRLNICFFSLQASSDVEIPARDRNTALTLLLEFAIQKGKNLSYIFSDDGYRPSTSNFF